ncbi:hypothetical protein [Convivina intestini]|uniref:Lactococcin 972 family bacteriocin n=1 Tax=Convivina intestini TaxID=1505726 RepID=A0A2U1DBM7_9LACO|nr:hypothetical protein [Convivina intestini]PVY85067.1 hypothetical protein C7384_10392 [Convivina intestini]CAH1853588.1 hypothetical protein R077811_00744 [Convivina intestini]SDB88934.1 hypothetical protein SAMN05216341_10362 [Leuconostocaceae bacterium R-53105]
MARKSFLGKVILGTGAVMALSLSGTVFASASGYWTITGQSVGAFGRWSSDGVANLKQTADDYASFNGDSLPAWLGYSSRLVNSNGTGMSTRVGVAVDQTTHADSSAYYRHYYWNDIRSSGWENNATNTRMHFSADWM